MSVISERTTGQSAGVAQTVCIYGALIILCTAAGWYFEGGKGLDLRVPVFYQGDGLFILTLIKRVMENPWVYSSSLMGAPFGSVTYDYPIPDSGSLLALKIFGRILGSPGAAYNAYFFTGFGLNAAVAYAVMRKLRLSKSLSFAGGIIFTLLPFHFMREGHLFYTWYFDAPAFTWLAFRTYRGTLDFFDGRRARVQLVDGAALLVLTCFGVYFAFFGALAIATAGLARLLRDRTFRSARGTIIAVAIVFAGVVVNVSPTIVYRHTHAADLEVEARNPPDSELYGLKITQMLLPRLGHRFAPFERLTANYSTTFPLVTENSTATLGIVGSVGFVALLLMLLTPRERVDERMLLLSFLAVVFVLFCSVGGFSALFALTISPAIRAWNRSSVFLGFFSITAALMLVQLLFNRIHGSALRHRTTFASAVVLCAFAVWDQTSPACLPCSASNASTFRSDDQFVAAVEHAAGAGSSIYQMPYVGFPEVPPVNKLGAYDQLLGFAHSKTLKWSLGGIKGREGDLTFRALAQQPVPQQIEAARKMGFTGVWVDLRGFPDGGHAVQAELTQTLGSGPALASPDGNQIFFRMASH